MQQSFNMEQADFTQQQLKDTVLVVESMTGTRLSFPRLLCDCRGWLGLWRGRWGGDWM